MISARLHRLPFLRPLIRHSQFPVDPQGMKLRPRYLLPGAFREDRVLHVVLNIEVGKSHRSEFAKSGQRDLSIVHLSLPDSDGVGSSLHTLAHR